MLYYDKEIYFRALYSKILKFFTISGWYNNGGYFANKASNVWSGGKYLLSKVKMIDIIKNYKCNYLNVLCKAGEECMIYNDIMKENIHNMNNQINAYDNYLIAKKNKWYCW